MRAAVTLTQCWHEVPGGTATAALHLVDALRRRDDVDLVGIGALGRPDTAFVPPIPTKRLHLPYQLLYEAWHRGFDAPEWVSGPVDLVHATAPMSPPYVGHRWSPPCTICSRCSNRPISRHGAYG
ncbi:MAG: hypothetical protein R2710_13720 [Acidimicrobiales bacterium]